MSVNGTRKIGSRTIISADNEGLLLEKETIISIANGVSKITGKKLQRTQIQDLVDFISQLSTNQFYQKPLYEVETRISNLYVIRRKPPATDLDDSAANYLTSEILATTANEHPYKHSAHADRQGRSACDRQGRSACDRQGRSVVNRKRAVNSDPTGNQDAVNKALLNSLEPVSSFFATGIDEIFERANSSMPGLQTFHNITFPHRTVPLDSRNRVLTHNQSNQIKFNLHAAGQPGRLGDIRIQDVLKSIIEVRICPFWLPVNNVMDDYYSTVRMHVNEFWQHAEVTEFLDSSESIPTVYGYHFEFEITRREKNRVYLVPVCDRYKFHKPIERVETLTLDFRSPFRPVDIEQDRGVFTMTYSPAAGDATVLTLASGSNHKLSTGNLIYILHSNSGNSALDSEIIREEGHIITRISNTEISIETDTNAVAGTQTNMTVLYGSKRIIMQMEFTSLER